jgi:hypothetical protein
MKLFLWKQYSNFLFLISFIPILFIDSVKSVDNSKNNTNKFHKVIMDFNSLENHGISPSERREAIKLFTENYLNMIQSIIEENNGQIPFEPVNDYLNSLENNFNTITYIPTIESNNLFLIIITIYIFIHITLYFIYIIYIIYTYIKKKNNKL